jgi:polar amino acid transport system substrate-binding protein
MRGGFMNLQSRIISAFAVGLFICAMVFPTTAMAQDVIVMTGEWNPFVSAGLENNGFTAEIVSQACLAVGIRPDFQFAPWPRCEAKVQYGKAFAAFPYSKTDARVKFALFSKPLAKSRTVFFYNRKKIKQLDFSDLGDLKSLLIGGVRGYYYDATLKKAGLSVDYSRNEDDSFNKLYMGRVDIVPVNELVGWGIINKLFPDQTDVFATTKRALDEKELYLMVSQKYPDAALLLERFNKGLETIKATGTYKAIIEKHKVPQTVGSFQ